ncbi:right-handed parallel beta-helix repeat-containing protein [Heyndrickxia vini]|uniref:Right-handed parallel beta-helix repeat-containing protein n=1 Tax=Heyndrickxia vini TaxID=1476025 RepID=A0ABX7E5E2_9BACI|nr:right-handed parallel beta-helix repeat-containing protein [Heyndrickxia vini]QQZ10017.1 right-handed parallel beta-helix repeat-containing protein [Heyndrickxia vini]
MLKKTARIIVIIMFMLCFLTPAITDAASRPTYTITTKSVPIDKQMLKYSTYNKYTKQYYVIRSYLEKLEKQGGGTLVLKKGTYSIPSTLYVPSNVTIRFQNGVKIVKGNKTNTKKLKTTKTLFQFIRPSRSLKKNVYDKYRGEKNISFIGEGTVSFDLKYEKDAIAIVAGHNQNLTIENIRFYHVNSGHFLEIDATNKAMIKNNQFIDASPSANKLKEGINLDTPDRTTKGFGHPWSKFDKTPNRNITIEHNVFQNLGRAIGTHKYSEGKYHENVVLRNNKISKTKSDAIRVMNWSNPTIENNTIENVDSGKGTLRGILASGVINPTIKGNTFKQVSRTMQFMPWKNEGPGSQYAITDNQITPENIDVFKTNHLIQVKEDFVRINHQYNVFDKFTDKIWITE